jgi:hypothetical protein
MIGIESMEPRLHQPGLNHDIVFALVRVDSDHGVGAALENRVTVKRVMRSESGARSEADRLNALNSDKGCYYFVQMTRLDRGELEMHSPVNLGSGNPESPGKPTSAAG